MQKRSFQTATSSVIWSEKIRPFKKVSRKYDNYYLFWELFTQFSRSFGKINAKIARRIVIKKSFGLEEISISLLSRMKLMQSRIILEPFWVFLEIFKEKNRGKTKIEQEKTETENDNCSSAAPVLEFFLHIFSISHWNSLYFSLS